MNKNEIPSLGYKPGNGWEQPEIDDIKVTDQYATLLQKDYDLLREYINSNNPPGKYSGVMWKKNEPGTDNWLLCWYRPADGAEGLMGYVVVETRKIIFQDLLNLIDIENAILKDDDDD